MLNGFDAM